uniref:Myoneurin n=1 Tax=Callorhinchus milii TaxID=7868 RepID=A0A4W3GN08_CALMI
LVLQDQHCMQLLDQLNKQRENGFLCDCTVVIGQLQFKAHRNVLAAFSGYFRAVYALESRVVFLDQSQISTEGFHKLLDFIYTGNINIDGYNAAEIHVAASYLQLEEVTRICKAKSEALTVNLSPISKGYSDLQKNADRSNDNTCISSSFVENENMKTRKRGARKAKKHDPDWNSARGENEANRSKCIRSGVDPESVLSNDCKNLLAENTTVQNTNGKQKRNQLQSNGPLPKQCKLNLEPQENCLEMDGKELKMKPICNICGKMFSEASSLRRHMRIHKGLKPYICHLCGKAFTQCNQLKTHVRTHTGEKPYQCNMCDKSFAQKCQLVFHSRMHHGQEKPYTCEVCDLQFATSSNLKIHARKHSGEKPYVCDRCGQRFAQASTLTYHVRRHTGEKPYICDTCGKAFAVSSSLITHARKHTGEKPYNCGTCGKSFISSGELNKHNRSHTGEKPFICELCGNSYTDVKNLKKHKNKVHSKSYKIGFQLWLISDSLQKQRIAEPVELKPPGLSLPLPVPLATEETQMLLPLADGQSLATDPLLRPPVTGYPEAQFIFLQHLY